MSALIKRDFLYPRVSGYITLAVLFLLTHFIQLSPYFLFMVFSLSIFISLFFYDYYYKMNRFFKSTPMQPSKQILSRYISCLLFIVSLVLAQLLFMFIITPHPYAANYYFYTLYDFIIVLSLGIILVAISIPLIHLFNSIYVSLTLIGVLFFTSMVLLLELLIQQASFDDFIDFNRLDVGYHILVEHYLPGFPYITLVLTSIILLVCSYYITVKLYTGKDLA